MRLLVEGIQIRRLPSGWIEKVLYRPSVHLYEDQEYTHRRTHPGPSGGIETKGDGICTFCKRSHRFGEPCR